MATVLLVARSRDPRSSDLTLVDAGTTTGYTLLELGLGQPEWDVVYSGARGTQGAKAAGSDPRNRPVTFALRVAGSSKDDLHTKLSALEQLADEFRRYGGTMTWRSHNQTYRQHFDVLAGAAAVAEYGRRYAHSNLLDVALELVCGPYLLGDPMDWRDDFSADHLAEYTFDGGVVGNVAVSGGELDAAANLTTEDRAVYTAYGYTFRDQQATVKSTPGATITSYKVGVVLKRTAATTYLEVYVDDNGTNSRLRLDKVVAGARTNLSSTNLGARIASGTPFFVRARLEGNAIFLEHFTAKPTPLATPTTSANHTLSTADAATFGRAISGSGGFVWIPQHTDAKLDDLAIEPNFLVEGLVPGDAPALAQAEISVFDIGGGVIAPWALLAWWEKPQNYNRVWNGDFSGLYLGGQTKWSVASVTNLNSGAATSISRVTTAAKYGLACGEIVCPANADRGAHFRMFRRFRRGVTYRAEVWIRAASAVTNVYVRLGNAAANDLGTSGNTALTTGWQRIFVDWTPTADRDDAHIAVNIAAATATTFQIDAVMVYEGTTAPAGASQTQGRGAYPPVGYLEGESNDEAVVTADAGSHGGFRADTTILETFNWRIDPSLVQPDDHTDTIAVEVWARLAIADAVTSLIATLSFSQPAAPFFTYTAEFGSEGRTVVLPSGADAFRVTRLGTLQLPRESDLLLHLELDPAGGGNVGVDYLLLVPARQRAASPSGLANDLSYPAFITLGSVEMVRTIRADLSGLLVVPEFEAAAGPGPGLAGALLEIPPGEIEGLLKVSSMVPDSPTLGSQSEVGDASTTVRGRLSVTPRWHLGRTA